MLGERRQCQRNAMDLPPEIDILEFSDKSQPCSDIQINGDGLN